MKKFLTFAFLSILAGVFITSCNQSRYPGFKKTDTGLYYKFYHRSNDTAKARLAEYALIEMVYGRSEEHTSELQSH